MKYDLAFCYLLQQQEMTPFAFCSDVEKLPDGSLREIVGFSLSATQTLKRRKIYSSCVEGMSCLTGFQPFKLVMTMLKTIALHNCISSPNDPGDDYP